MEFNATLFILQAATFLIGLWLSAKLFLPYLNGWMEQRQKRIRDQFSAAEKNQKEAEALRAELEKKVKDLDRETVDILQKTRQEAAQIREEAIQVARKETELILAEARKAIESERLETAQKLQSEMGTMAVLIAEKIIRSSLDMKAQERLVNESVKELTARKN